MLRYIVLESLYARSGGALTRILTALMEGISLGALQYEPTGAATGYLAFLALALYLTGLFFLRSASPAGTALERRGPEVTALRVLVVVALIGSTGCREPAWAPPTTGPGTTRTVAVESTVRERALSGARVWHPPAVNIGSAVLGHNPPGFPDDQDVTCRFLMRRVGGTTPKFDCTLPSGEVVKVKYGAGNPELHAEVAATRLLAALGFGADRMYRRPHGPVRRLPRVSASRRCGAWPRPASSAPASRRARLRRDDRLSTTR